MGKYVGDIMGNAGVGEVRSKLKGIGVERVVVLYLKMVKIYVRLGTIYAFRVYECRELECLTLTALLSNVCTPQRS